MDQLVGLLIAALLPITIALVAQGRNIGRLLIVSSVFVFCFTYLLWRVGTFPWVNDSLFVEWLWWLLVLAIELAVIVEVVLFLITITWLSDRRGEAADAQNRLRQHWQAHGDSAVPSVDLFITTYNEGLEVLEKTILGATQIDYPRLTVYVLDDGHREWLYRFCKDAGAEYITRTDNKGAKAGNINNALGQSDSDLVMIMDADFVPFRNCIWMTAGFFEDPSIGTVQTPQNFYNPDALQHNLGIAGSWSDEQSFFFRLIARGRDSLGVAFCCGSCSIHRRSALEEIGGFPTDSITEDILLTIRFCQLGLRTVYLAEPISTGLAPETLASFFVQRKRWARGGIQVGLLMMRITGLTWLQRVLFLPYSWVTQYTSRLFFQLVPIVFFVTGVAPLPDTEMLGIIQYQLPFLLSLVSAMVVLSEGYYIPFFSEAISLFSAFEIAPEIVAALIKPFGKGFAVTPKGNDSLSQQARPYRQVIFPASLLLGVNIVVLAEILLSGSENVSGASQMLVLYGLLWCTLNTLLLVVSILVALEKPQPRLEHRMRIDHPCQLMTDEGVVINARLQDISLSGALVHLAEPIHSSGSIHELVISESLRLRIKGCWQRSEQMVALSFSGLEFEAKRLLIGYMFSGKFLASSQPLQLSALGTSRQILRLSMGSR